MELLSLPVFLPFTVEQSRNRLHKSEIIIKGYTNYIYKCMYVCVCVCVYNEDELELETLGIFSRFNKLQYIIILIFQADTLWENFFNTTLHR